MKALIITTAFLLGASNAIILDFSPDLRDVVIRLEDERQVDWNHTTFLHPSTSHPSTTPTKVVPVSTHLPGKKRESFQWTFQNESVTEWISRNGTVGKWTYANDSTTLTFENGTLKEKSVDHHEKTGSGQPASGFLSGLFDLNKLFGQFSVQERGDISIDTTKAVDPTKCACEDIWDKDEYEDERPGSEIIISGGWSRLPLSTVFNRTGKLKPPRCHQLAYSAAAAAAHERDHKRRSPPCNCTLYPDSPTTPPNNPAPATFWGDFMEFLRTLLNFNNPPEMNTGPQTPLGRCTDSVSKGHKAERPVSRAEATAEGTSRGG